MDRPGGKALGVRRNGEYREGDVRPDFVILDCPPEQLEQAALSWRKIGAEVCYPFRLNHGPFREYLDGGFDGTAHWDEVQTDRNGSRILRGPGMPYLVPTLSFLDYVLAQLKRAVDCGVGEICLEEPEFRANSGYSPAFQAEWELFYGCAYQPPHTHRAAYAGAQRLKLHLILRTVNQLAERLKAYGKYTYRRELGVWVSARSLMRCRQNEEICPLSLIAASPHVDGLVAQIDPLEMRTPLTVGGKRQAREFESAWLEYAYFEQLAKGNRKDLRFVMDPEEDPGRNNGFPLLAAAMLQPEEKGYLFRKTARVGPLSRTVMHCLPEFSRMGSTLREGMEPVGVLVSDTALLQPPDAAPELPGESLPGFYGLCLPLLRRGIPVRPVNADSDECLGRLLADLRVLIVSYGAIKPHSSSVHFRLSEWVRGGGVLIYVGDDSGRDPGTPAWWNAGEGRYQTPEEHLQEALGVANKIKLAKQRKELFGKNRRTASDLIFEEEKGVCAWLKLPPELCATDEEAAEEFCRLVLKAAQMGDVPLRPDGVLQRQKGVYRILHVPDDAPRQEPIKGPFVDLTDPEFPVRATMTAEPGQTLFLYDLSKKIEMAAEILAASVYITDTVFNEVEMTFTALLPNGSPGACRLYAPFPAEVTLNGASVPAVRDRSGKTLFFRLEDSGQVHVRRKN